MNESITKPQENGSIGFVEASMNGAESRELDGIDPTYKIEWLAAANRKPISIKPEEPLNTAVTVMLAQNFSQLPVMRNEYDVRGMISWKGIGSKLALNGSCSFAHEAMETAHVVRGDDPLLSAIQTIAQHDYVLVKNNKNQITGIVTASDFSIQFQQLAEPFLLIEEIERGVRQILHGKFDKSELNSVKLASDSDRTVNGLENLSFGEYIRLIESDSNWKKLGLAIDRAYFTKSLNQIREIRNKVMHFNSRGLADADSTTLREFAGFLRRLREITTRQSIRV
jgi:CBS domain-containing protein